MGDNSRSHQSYSIRIARETFVFSAAHCAHISESSSETLHGHNYRVAVQIRGEPDKNGIVMDFALVKAATTRIVRRLNHRVLIPSESSRISHSESEGETTVLIDQRRYVFPSTDVVHLPIPNTTCECLAKYIGSEVLEALGLSSIEVTVEESDNQSATWSCEAGK